METTTCSTNMGSEKATTQPMKRRRDAIVVAAVTVGAVVWYLFRPELLFINKSVNEAFPTAADTSSPSGQARMHGMFHGAAHETKGAAAIYELADGTRVLRLTRFETSNGPDVHVLLGKAADAADSDTVKTAGYIDLGSLKGNIGDQNYDIPADTKLTEFNSVTIWCNRFNVNFGTAPLNPTDSMSKMIDARQGLASGSFHAVAHETKGTAAVHELAMGKYVLRLTGFETSNGPDVHVLLGKAPDAADSDTVKAAGYVDLGSLKGNIGDQNYEIPTDVKPSDFNSVTIWCNRFSVNFGTAPLKMN
jgi:Electron transfer DM13